MPHAKQSKLQKFKIPNPNIKKLLKKLRNRIAFDFFQLTQSPSIVTIPHFRLFLLIIFLFYHCISYIMFYIIMLLIFV